MKKTITYLAAAVFSLGALQAYASSPDKKPTEKLFEVCKGGCKKLSACKGGGCKR